MSNLSEKFKKNPVITEIEEKEWKLFENREAKLRDQKHLEANVLSVISFVG